MLLLKWREYKYYSLFIIWKGESIMKKYMVLSLVILTITIIISATGVQAYLQPGSTTFAGVELKSDKSKYTSDRRTKINSIEQQYYHVGSTTFMSPDCTDCIVSTDLYEELDNVDAKISSTTTVKGELKNMADSAVAGNYFVKLWRVNPGIIKTTHSGTWYINITKLSF